jgi:hypothetical protein
MNARHRIRALLRWARIEDENGALSLTTVAFAIGIYCILAGKPVELSRLSAFAVALGMYQGKRFLAHRRTMKAMDTASTHGALQMQNAHDAAMAKRADAADALAEKVESLAAQVRELKTPEHMAAVRKALGRG